MRDEVLLFVIVDDFMAIEDIAVVEGIETVDFPETTEIDAVLLPEFVSGWYFIQLNGVVVGWWLLIGDEDLSEGILILVTLLFKEIDIAVGTLAYLSNFSILLLNLIGVHHCLLSNYNNL